MYFNAIYGKSYDSEKNFLGHFFVIGSNRYMVDATKSRLELRDVYQFSSKELDNYLYTNIEEVSIVRLNCSLEDVITKDLKKCFGQRLAGENMYISNMLDTSGMIEIPIMIHKEKTFDTEKKTKFLVQVKEVEGVVKELYFEAFANKEKPQYITTYDILELYKDTMGNLPNLFSVEIDRFNKCDYSIIQANISYNYIYTNGIVNFLNS